MKLRDLEAKADKARRKVKGLEYLKVGEAVFDKSTLLTLYYLVNKGVIDSLGGIIKTGKESHVFLSEGGGKTLAVKIHRITTSDYKGMLKYLEGDPRFRGIRKSKRSMIHTWVKKEFRNLGRAREAGVAVPKPVAYRDNVLVMGFIGRGKLASPMLKNVGLSDPEAVLKEVTDAMQKLYCSAGLVHSDLSEYNILMKGEKPVVIDFSHAVVREHPLAEEFLVRDVGNIARFFQDYLSVEPSDIMDHVKDCDGLRKDTQG